MRLHVEDGGGGGRPVVLIHGWPLSARSWQPQASVLQDAGYRVVAYDRRGFGQSDKPHAGYDYDTLADDLLGVMDACGLQDVTLIGFSMGGGEAVRYVARHGESRLHGVVLAAAVTPFLKKSADNPQGLLRPAAAKAQAASLERDRGAFFEQFTTALYAVRGRLQVTELERREAADQCTRAAPHAALACMAAFGTTDFRPDLPHITVPTLVIHGDADAIVPLEASGLRTHQAVRHSQLLTLRDAPHGLNLTHRKAFNNALLAFLKTA